MAEGAKTKALQRLDRMEKTLLAAQASIPGLVRDVQELREMIDRPKEDEDGQTKLDADEG